MLVPALLQAYYDGHVAKLTTDTPRVTKIAIGHLSKHFRASHVEKITEEEVAAYAKKRKCAHGTVRRELSTIVTATKWAVRKRKFGLTVLDVPCIDLPPPSPERDVWLTREQALKLIAYCDARAQTTTLGWRLALFVRLGLFTGQRPNAIRYLAWERVNMKSQVLDFNRGLLTGKKRYGKVKCMPELWPAIVEAEDKRWMRGPTEWVLGNTESLDGQFRRAVAACGLPSSMTPNTLRHTWATWAAQDSVDLWRIAGVLGNSYATVEKKYAHHHPDFQGLATSRRIFTKEDGQAIEDLY